MSLHRSRVVTSIFASFLTARLRVSILRIDQGAYFVILRYSKRQLKNSFYNQNSEFMGVINFQIHFSAGPHRWLALEPLV
jgi:hypothetical protein